MNIHEILERARPVACSLNAADSAYAHGYEAGRLEQWQATKEVFDGDLWMLDEQTQAQKIRADVYAGRKYAADLIQERLVQMIRSVGEIESGKRPEVRDGLVREMNRAIVELENVRNLIVPDESTRYEAALHRIYLESRRWNDESGEGK